MADTPTYTTPGGIIIPGSAETANLSAILRSIFDASLLGGAGLNNQSIPKFPTVEALTAAFPDPTAASTPALAQVITAGTDGDPDIVTLFRYDPVLSRWNLPSGTPLGVFTAGAADTIGKPIANGAFASLTDKVFTPTFRNQVQATFSWSGAVSPENTGCVAQLELEVNGSIRRTFRLQPSTDANLVMSGSGQSFTDYFPPDVAINFLVRAKKISGPGGVNGVPGDSQLTSAQAVLVAL